MSEKRTRKRKLILMGVLLIALGITLTNILKESIKYVGILFIAAGGLLFILGLRSKS